MNKVLTLWERRLGAIEKWRSGSTLLSSRGRRSYNFGFQDAAAPET